MDITRLVRLVLVFTWLIVIPFAVSWRLSASPAPQNGSQTNATERPYRCASRG
jgi:hypothetical protein